MGTAPLIVTIGAGSNWGMAGATARVCHRPTNLPQMNIVATNAISHTFLQKLLPLNVKPKPWRPPGHRGCPALQVPHTLAQHSNPRPPVAGSNRKAPKHRTCGGH